MRSKKQSRLLNSYDYGTSFEDNRGVNQYTTDGYSSEYFNDNKQTIKYSDALSKVGGQNRYQILLALNIGTQWILMSMVFMTASFWLQEPKFLCDDGKVCNEQKALQQGRCQKEFIYNEKGYKTITEDLNLYCENGNLLYWTQSVVFIGASIGSFILPQISDRSGRKFPIFISQIVAGLCLAGMAFVDNYILYMVLYFILGFVVWPCETIMYSLLNESITGKLREIALIGCMMFWGLGEVVVSILGYYIKDWRFTMLYCIAIPYLVYSIPNLLLVFESPMLFLKKDPKRCIKIMNQIGRFNSKDLIINDNLQIIPDEQEVQQKQNQKPQKSYHIGHLFSYGSLRKITVTCSLAIGGANMLYFGSSLSLSDIGSNVYFSMLVVGTCETLCTLLCAFIASMIPRKRGYILFYGITIIICVSFAYFPYDHARGNNEKLENLIKTIMAGIARVFNIFTLAIYALYSQEVFPTPVRSMGTGFTYSFSTILTFLGPFQISLAKHLNVYPTFILGLSGLLFLLPCFFFEETLGKPLKDDIKEELKVLKKRKKKKEKLDTMDI